MPRRGRGQQPAAPTGQAYGDNQAQIAAQREIPLPDAHAPAPAQPGQAAPGPEPAPPVDPMAMAALAAQNVEVPSAPWAAGPMSEEITAGLPSGPGPGPEILQRRAARPGMADTLMEIARTTGDTRYAELAQIVAAGDR